MVTILLLSVAVLTLSGSMWTARDVTVATPLPTSGGQHLFRGANSMLGLQLASHRVQTTKYGATQWSSEDHGGSSVKEMSRFSSDRLPLPLKMYQTGLMQNVRGRNSRLPERDQDNMITFGDSKLDGFVPEPSDVDGNKQTIQEEASEESQSPLKGILGGSPSDQTGNSFVPKAKAQNKRDRWRSTPPCYFNTISCYGR